MCVCVYNLQDHFSILVYYHFVWKFLEHKSAYLKLVYTDVYHNILKKLRMLRKENEWTENLSRQCFNSQNVILRQSMLISEMVVDNKHNGELCNNHKSNSSFRSSESNIFQSTAAFTAEIRVHSI